MKVNVEITPQEEPTPLLVIDVVDTPAVYEIHTPEHDELDYLVVLARQKYFMVVCAEGDVRFVDADTLRGWENYGCRFVRTAMNLDVRLS